MVRLASVVHLDDISTAYKTLKLEEGGEVGVCTDYSRLLIKTCHC